ncbi:MAG: hypothetical protein RL266_2785 [Bacteroidota bacterium]|jgi:site-specific recombinase
MISEDSMPEDHIDGSSKPDQGSGRHKQKIRIKYRQRVKIKRRPRGYKIQRFWKKHSKNVFSYLVLALLIGATLFMVLQVVKQQIEFNKHEKNQKLRVK